MTRKALAAVVLAGAFAFVAASCGGGDEGGNGGSGSSEGQVYEEAVVAAFREADDGEESPIPEEDARCAADRFVGILGADRLVSAGITPEEIRNSDSLSEVVPDLTTADADRLSQAIQDCIDFGTAFAAGLADSAAADGVTLHEDKLECLGENFEASERLREAFAMSILTGVEPDFGADTDPIIEILGDCLTIKELIEIGQQTADG
jgi:hypothetical protein